MNQSINQQSINQGVNQQSMAAITALHHSSIHTRQPTPHLSTNQSMLVGEAQVSPGWREHKRQRSSPSCQGCIYEEATGFTQQALSPDWGCRGSQPSHHGQRGCRLAPGSPSPTPPATPSPARIARIVSPARIASPACVASPFQQDDDALYDESPSPLARNYDAVPTLEQCGDCKKANKPGDLCEAGLCKGCCDGISCWPAPAPDAVADAADAAALGDAGYYKVRRFKQAQLQLAPVAPVESPIADTLCDHPMLIIMLCWL